MGVNSGPIRQRHRAAESKDTASMGSAPPCHDQWPTLKASGKLHLPPYHRTRPLREPLCAASRHVIARSASRSGVPRNSIPSTPPKLDGLLSHGAEVFAASACRLCPSIAPRCRVSDRGGRRRCLSGLSPQRRHPQLAATCLPIRIPRYLLHQRCTRVLIARPRPSAILGRAGGRPHSIGHSMFPSTRQWMERCMMDDWKRGEAAGHVGYPLRGRNSLRNGSPAQITMVLAWAPTSALGTRTRHGGDKGASSSR
jgi:hypothetical protein